MSIVSRLLTLGRLTAVNLLQEATQLPTTTTATLNLRTRDRRSSICRLDRGDGWCIGRWRFVMMLARREVL